MSFRSDIPIPTDPMARSQKQILANFQAIFAGFAQNHASLGTQNQGLHNALVFREQTGNPTTSANQVALYTKNVSSVPQLFFRPNNNQTPIQLTSSDISTGLASTNPDVFLNDQYSFAAGPFVIYGGKFTNVVNNQTKTLSPASTLIYVGMTITSQQSLPINGGTVFFVGAKNLSGSSFDVVFHNAIQPQDIYYMAIGIP